MEHVINLLPDGPRTYVTSTITLLPNDAIKIYVQNFSNSEDPKTTRVQIYKNIGPKAEIVFDSGETPITREVHVAFSYNLDDGVPGDFWIQIDLSSDMLIPKVAFEKETGDRWTPFVYYKPGDFAVFDAQQRRLR